MDSANPTCPANPDWSEYPEMRFTAHEADGQQVLLAEGLIDANAATRLQSALEIFDGEEVWLRSPGGNARAGNEAGRLIRDSGLSTRIPSGWTCLGACNFMFMGGVSRSVDTGGWFMVRTDPPFEIRGVPPEERQARAREIAAASALLATEDIDFAIRMGIRRSLLSDIMYRRSEDGSTRRCLTAEELAGYDVTTRFAGSQSITGPGETDRK
jgi:hypothetical protein